MGIHYLLHGECESPNEGASGLVDGASRKDRNRDSRRLWKTVWTLSQLFVFTG